MSLKTLRLNRGLSVAACATAVGVPDHVVRHAESGGRPRPENALRLADFFGCKVTDLWPVEDDDAPAKAAA